jgi:hypothetical protein
MCRYWPYFIVFKPFTEPVQDNSVIYRVSMGKKPAIAGFKVKVGVPDRPALHSLNHHKLFIQSQIRI